MRRACINRPRITFVATAAVRKLLLEEQYRRTAEGRKDWSLEQLGCASIRKQLLANPEFEEALKTHAYRLK
jgi:hypothetical protein